MNSPHVLEPILVGMVMFTWGYGLLTHGHIRPNQVRRMQLLESASKVQRLDHLAESHLSINRWVSRALASKGWVKL